MQNDINIVLLCEKYKNFGEYKFMSKMKKLINYRLLL